MSNNARVKEKKRLSWTLMDLSEIKDASTGGAVSGSASDFVPSGSVNKVLSKNLTIH